MRPEADAPVPEPPVHAMNGSPLQTAQTPGTVLNGGSCCHGRVSALQSRSGCLFAGGDSGTDEQNQASNQPDQCRAAGGWVWLFPEPGVGPATDGDGDARDRPDAERDRRPAV